LLSATMQLSST